MAASLPFLYQTRTLYFRGRFRSTPAQVRRSLHASSPCCKRKSSASIRIGNRIATSDGHKLMLPKNSARSLQEDNSRPDPVVGRKPRNLDDQLYARQTKESSSAINLGTAKGSRTTTQKNNPFEDGEIPFLSLPESLHSDEILDGDLGESFTQPRKESTITIRERLAFDRIFADIMASSKPSGANSSQESLAMDNEPVITTKALGPGETTFDTLDSTDIDAWKSMESEQLPSSDTWTGKESQEELMTAVHRYPPTLRAAAAKALGLVSPMPFQRSQEGEQSEAQTEPIAPKQSAEDCDNIDRLEDIRQPERERVEDLMRAAANDAELWQIMEKEVFSLIERLGFASHSAIENKKTKPQGLDPLDRFIYGPLYPSHLLLGLRLLDRSFARPSPLVLNVLPRIKSLGVISHVLGASTPFYNELLRIYWSRHDDFRGVLRLLSEMEQAVLEFDEETLSIIDEIDDMQRKVKRGDHGPGLQELWSMPEFAPGRFKTWQKKIQSLLEGRDSDVSGKVA